MQRIMIAVMAFTAAIAVIPPVAMASSPSLDRDEAFEVLSEALRLSPLPADPQACALSISSPDGTTTELECGADDDPGATATESSSSSAFELEASSMLESPGWYASTGRLEGRSEETFVRVHGHGDIAATTVEGATVWTRGSMSFYEDWGLKNGWIVPFILLGAAPLDPRTQASERPYALADVTGDGTDDVIVSHWVWQRDSSMKITTSSVLSVLDGRTGETSWSKEYPGYLTQVVASGGTIVVGRETGDIATRPVGHPQGEDGSTSTLFGLEFDQANGNLRATQTWAIPTGRQWVRWLAAEPMPGGLVAAAWMDKAFGATSGTPGHTLLVDAASGSVRWQHDSTAGYPRMLRHDASRNAVLVAEVADPTVPEANGATADEPHRYTLRALDLSAGESTGSIVRTDAILLSLAVADLDGVGSHEWVLGDLMMNPHPNGTSPGTARVQDLLLGARVAALDPAGVRWTSEQQCAHGVPAAATCGTLPYTYSVAVAGSPPTVIAASINGASTHLRGLSGSAGEVIWQAPDAPFPLALATVEAPGGPAIAGVNLSRIQRAYDAAAGQIVMSAPIPFEIHAADAVDLDGDGFKEVIAGGEGGVVFAFDFSQPEPRILWSTEIGGPIHKIEIVDLGSDGERDILAAASSELAVLDLGGDPRPSRTITYPNANDYVFTFTTGDVDGDGRTDVVVPTTELTAYEGRSGNELWSFAGTNPAVLANFSDAVITPDHKVAAQWMTRSGVPFLNARSHMLITAIDGPTGVPAWQKVIPSKFGIINLWRSVLINPDESCGPGSTIGFTWKETITTNTTSGWFARTDFYDSTTGDLCYGVSQPQGIEHMGTTHIPGIGVLEYNWLNVAHLRRSGVTETPFADDSYPTADVAMGNFGTRGPRFLKAWTSVDAFAADSPTGAHGRNPPKLATWSRFDSGSMLVEDLDGDGVDEVIAMPFDWNGWFTVASFTAVFGFRSSLLPISIAVLEPR